jgi:pimeloyl-ACP methyl ester carboxylesterase
MNFETIAHNGRNVRVASVGEGTPVVLLHGFPDGPRSWAETADALASAGHRAVVPYLRGYHPDTIAPGRPYGRAEIGADVIHLLAALGLERAVLVGHDWGAACVWSAVSQFPNRAMAVVPIAIPHPASMKPSVGLMWGVRHFFNLKAPLSDRRVARNNFAYIDKLYERWAPRWRGASRGAAVADAKVQFSDEVVLHEALQWYRDLSFKSDPMNDFRVPCPGLLVVGGADFGGDLEPYERSVARFDAPADLLVIDGAGHWPHREGQAEFDERLVAFVDGVAAAG